MRHAIRRFRQDPGLLLLVTLTLAFGVGVNSALFSIMNGLHRPLPVRDADRLVVLATRRHAASGGVEGMQYRFTYPALQDFRAQARSYDGLIAFDLGHGGLSVSGKAQEFLFTFVTGNYFSVLGINPAAGRLFSPGEGESPDAPLSIVLGHAYWRKRFGGDPGVVGRQVRLSGVPATIVGVADSSFRGTYANSEMDGFATLSYLTRSGKWDGGSFFHDRANPRLTLMAILNPGVSLASARAEAQVIATRLERQYPATDAGISVDVLPETWARPAPIPSMVAMAPAAAGVFLLLGVFVLLIACLNVSDVLLVRAAAREREMAVRAALGSGRARLVRLALADTLLLAMIGGIAGMTLGAWATAAVSAIPGMTAGNIPVLFDFGFDWRVFAYAFAATLLAAAAAGIWPALAASRPDIAAVLHGGGRSASQARRAGRSRSIMVVAQVAGSLTLLIVAGSFAAGVDRARRIDLGFDPQHLAAFVMDTAYAGYDRDRGIAFYDELQRRVRALPGVDSAAIASAMPLNYVQDGDAVEAEGRPPSPGRPAPVVMLNSVSPEYFDAMRLDLRAGRKFRDSDRDGAPRVAIVNETMARRVWPGQDPLGKRFRIRRTADAWWEVVGVARDGKYFALFEPPLPYFYVPAAQIYASRRVLQVRSAALPPDVLLKTVEAEIRALDPDLPLNEARMMEEAIEGTTGLWGFRLGAYLTAGLGLIGLGLAMVGVYGVVSYAARQRSREIGIRMALGADPRDVLRLVVGRGAIPVACGVAIGGAGAWALARVVNRAVSDAIAPSPIVFLAAGGFVAAVALWASYVPARRAIRLDPMNALRHE